MDNEHTPERPEWGSNAGGPTPPRMAVEPTPQNRDDEPSETTQMPGSGTQEGTGATEHIPFVPSTATDTRTVVKVKTKKLPVFLASLGGLVVGAVLVIALVMVGAFRISDTDVSAEVPVTQTIDIDPEDTTLAEAVAAKCLPSVVSISTETQEGGGVGSGAIIDTDGNILTNYHVIEGATAISVTVNDETSYEAEIVGTDESSDLAVIRLVDADTSTLTPIEIGDSDDLSRLATSSPSPRAS